MSQPSYQPLLRGKTKWSAGIDVNVGHSIIKKNNWAELCRAQLRLSLLLINQKLASYSLVVSALSSIPGAVNVIN